MCYVSSPWQSRILLLLILLIGGVLLLTPLNILVHLNIASLARLHYAPSSERYLYVLTRTPNNTRLRVLTTEALLHEGKYEQAYEIARPLVTDNLINSTTAQIFIAAAIAVEHHAEAAKVLEVAYPSGELPLWIQANLVPAELHAQTETLKLTDPEIIERLARAVVWQQALRPYGTGTDNAEITEKTVAAILNLPLNQIRLSPNKIANNGFDHIEPRTMLPLHWESVAWVGGEHTNQGLFLVGVDRAAYKGNYALRIDGIGQHYDPTKEPARAGVRYVSYITVAPGSTYVISFVYRTQPETNPDLRLFLNYDASTQVGEQWLPTTNGEWRRVLIVARSRTNRLDAVWPLLRVWGKGSAWIDEFSFQTLTFTKPIDPHEPIIVYTDP